MFRAVAVVLPPDGTISSLLGGGAGKVEPRARTPSLPGWVLMGQTSYLPRGKLPAVTGQRLCKRQPGTPQQEIKGREAPEFKIFLLSILRWPTYSLRYLNFPLKRNTRFCHT